MTPASLETLTMEIPPRLKEYLDANRRVYLESNRGSLLPVTDPDEPLQIDSLGLIRLVSFLENDLGIRIEDEELIADNFATLRRLGELLATKTLTEPTGEARALEAEPCQRSVQVPTTARPRERET